MTDREALAAALDDWTTDGPPPWQVKATVIQAARERLAQLPPYPPEVLERVAETIWKVPQTQPDYRAWTQVVAVAVLNSLNGGRYPIRGCERVGCMSEAGSAIGGEWFCSDHEKPAWAEYRRP